MQGTGRHKCHTMLTNHQGICLPLYIDKGVGIELLVYIFLLAAQWWEWARSESKHAPWF